MRKLWLCNWVGNCKFNLLTFVFIFISSGSIFGLQNLNLKNKFLTEAPQIQDEWVSVSLISLRAKKQKYNEGVSYMMSGALALIGGIAGAKSTNDPFEQGAYALFQTIGVASVGYGAYQMNIDTDESVLIKSLNNSQLPNSQKLKVLNGYNSIKLEQKKSENKIKAITHALIASLNFYNASEQTSAGVKNSLYFVGGINILASLSYAF